MHSIKVLIVDDSHLLQVRLLNAIKNIDENMNVFQAYNCQEALDLFSSFSPDTVILDISLPDGSGISLLKEFKKYDPSISVIMFTNYPTDEFKKHCLELGADCFLDKSNVNELINIISTSKIAI